MAVLHRVRRAGGARLVFDRPRPGGGATSRTTCARRERNRPGTTEPRTCRQSASLASERPAGRRSPSRLAARPGRSSTARGDVPAETSAASSGWSIDRVEFAGYGLDAPRANHVDFAGKDVKGAAVVWLGARGPRAVNASASAGLLAGRNRYATEQLHAAAGIGPCTGREGREGQEGRRGRRRTGRPDSGRGLHDVPASRPAGGAEHDRIGCVLRVPLQPRAQPDTTS